MDLAQKLQIKPGQALAVVQLPSDVIIEVAEAELAEADGILVFVKNKVELDIHFPTLQAAAQAGKLTWVAYPKAGQLETNLNRDILHDYFRTQHLDAVRQIAINEVWSALRFKTL